VQGLDGSVDGERSGRLDQPDDHGQLLGAGPVSGAGQLGDNIVRAGDEDEQAAPRLHRLLSEGDGGIGADEQGRHPGLHDQARRRVPSAPAGGLPRPAPE
jgi:hypothetical protein